MENLPQKLLSAFFITIARIVTGVVPIWIGSTPSTKQRIYFANHSSHGDFIAIMACMNEKQRQRLYAVAGSDYWSKGKLRSFIARSILKTVLVERQKVTRTNNPLTPLIQALHEKKSLILFPEGTRNTSTQKILKFHSGIYKLAKECPTIELVPCWIENMSRVLPKGSYFPIPVLCRVHFGSPQFLKADEDKIAFLQRMQNTLLELSELNILQVHQERVSDQSEELLKISQIMDTPHSRPGANKVTRQKRETAHE